MFAASGPFPQTVKLLVERGSELDAVDGFEGWTALMFAAGEGNEEVCKVLLEAGADPGLKDSDGDTALDHAKANQQKAVIELLRKK